MIDTHTRDAIFSPQVGQKHTHDSTSHDILRKLRRATKFNSGAHCKEGTSIRMNKKNEIDIGNAFYLHRPEWELVLLYLDIVLPRDMACVLLPIFREVGCFN